MYNVMLHSCRRTKVNRLTKRDSLCIKPGKYQETPQRLQQEGENCQGNGGYIIRVAKRDLREKRKIPQGDSKVEEEQKRDEKECNQDQSCNNRVEEELM